MTLSHLLTTARQEILDDAARALGRAHLTSYEAVGDEESRARLALLYDLVTEAIASRNLTAVRQHAARIADERFTAGFGLGEVQSAYNVLEEAIWKAIVERLPPAALAEAFGLVSTALGAGKDRLATAYVELASHAKAPALDLRALFAGTAG